MLQKWIYFWSIEVRTYLTFKWEYRVKLNWENVTTIRKEYIDGEIPSMEAPRPAPAGDDIVYSPNKYRETEGIKES